MIPHADLVLALTRNRLSARIGTSLLGWLWLVLNPLLTILLLSLVFGGLLEIRWGVDGGPAYPLALFGGLIVHFFVAEALTRGPTLVSERPEYVQKIRFPLSALGVVNVLEGGLLFLSALLLFLLAAALTGFAPAPAWLLIPLVVLPAFLYALAISWALGAFGPYLPDLKQLVGQLATGLLLLSPVLYPLSRVPENLQPLFLLNPSTTIVENLRLVVFEGTAPSAASLLGPLAASALSAIGAYLLFRKLERGFADVL